MNKPINVLFTMANNSTAPYFEWFADLSLKSEDINLSFVMFTKERPELEKKYRDRGIQVHWIDFDCDQRKKQIFKAARKFRKLVRIVKPDIVHSHLFDDALICRIGLWMKSKPKFIVTKADTGFHYRYTPKWMILDKSINRKSAHLVAISGECKQFIIAEENTPADKISVIHHGIPKEVFAKDYDQEIREVKSLYPIEDKLLFCTVSRYIDWKGYLDIIDAIDKAR
ncbi:MAG: glycosyltransferase, partial [Flavobacteriales bacterium]|nr:glycosyltransferase [Flavobacteriales bacterium]